LSESRGCSAPQAFQDQDAEVRKEAISHFNQYPDLRAIEPLIKLLKDPDASVRNEALHIIYNNKDPRIVPPMVDVLRNSKETVDNRYQAAWGLNFTEDRRAVDPFLAVLRDRSAPSLVRFEVTVGLQRIGEGRAVEPLIAALRDSSEPVVVRIGTAQALAKFGDRRATDLMIQIAKSDGPRDLRFWGAIGAAELTQGTINDLHCITPIIDCYRALDGVEYDLAAKGNALATIVEHAKNQTIRWAAARMLFGIAPDGCFKPRLSDDEKETAAERDTEAQLDLGMQALRERKLHDARSCFEKSEKHLARIASRERRIAFQSQAICGMAAIAETEPRWSKMTAAEMAAEQEGVDALRDKATIYFRGDPYVMHDARHSVPPSVPVGADSLVEGLIAVGFHTQGRFREADMKYLEKMPGLRMLCLEQADITRRGLMHINGLKNLEYLGLPSSITNADLPKLLDFQRLSVLHLQGKGITDEGLKHVARLRGLTRLSLSGTAITDAGLKDLKSLSSSFALFSVVCTLSWPPA
jgi:HEAT repeat protein